MAPSDEKQMFDWKAFRDMLDKRMSSLVQDRGAHDVSWIDDFVKQTMSRSLPAIEPKPAASAARTEMFQTHRSVIARARLPEKVKAEDVRIFVHANRLQIQYSDRHSEDLALPVLVNARKSRAEYRSGIIEIRMPKRTKQGGGKEIFLEFPGDPPD